jgi:anti-anti-sigma factor
MSPASSTCPLQFRENGETTVVQFASQGVRLDENNTQAVSDELQAFLERQSPRTLLIDFENVAFLTSTTLGMLLVLRKGLQARGCRLVLAHLNPQVYEVFETTRLHELFEVRRDGAGPAAGDLN